MKIASTRRSMPAHTRPSVLDSGKIDRRSLPVEPMDDLTLSSIKRDGWSTALAAVITITQDMPHSDLIGLARKMVDEQRADGGWAEESSAQNTDRDSSVLHHVALTTFLRRAEHAKAYKKLYTREGYARYNPDEETSKQLEAALERSWKRLTGGVPKGRSEFLGALPKHAISDLSEGPAALHAALLGDSLEVRLDPDKAIDKALSILHEDLLGAAKVKPKADWSGPAQLLGAAALGAGALAATAGTVGLGAAASVVAPLAVGMAVGWMAASYNESLIHDKVLHVQDLPGTGKIIAPDQPKSLVTTLYEHAPESMKKPVYDAWFGHTKIHHYRTFVQDHATQFRSSEEEERLNDYLLKEGQEQLIDEEHGMTIGWSGYLRFQAVASPVYAMALGATALLGVGTLGVAATVAAAPLVAAGFAVPTLTYPIFSKDYHRFTHMPGQKALKTASWPMKKFVQSPMSRHIVRRHFVHHEDELVNFNLMPGADALRGKAREPNVAQEEEMRRLKLLW